MGTQVLGQLLAEETRRGDHAIRRAEALQNEIPQAAAY
jgi:hypothetical protein